MLVLSRKTGEKIVIGEKGEIVLHVLAIRPNGSVQIGIEADPQTVPVYREEIWMKKKEEEEGEV